MIEYARFSMTLRHPVENVWAVVQSFGAAKLWMDGIESCSVDSDGTDVFRVISRGGRTVREKLLKAADLTLRYTLIEPHRLPATGVVSTLVLEADEDERSTRATWISEAKSIDGEADEMRAYIEALYASSLNNLNDLL